MACLNYHNFPNRNFLIIFLFMNLAFFSLSPFWRFSSLSLAWVFHASELARVPDMFATRPISWQFSLITHKGKDASLWSASTNKFFGQGFELLYGEALIKLLRMPINQCLRILFSVEFFFFFRSTYTEWKRKTNQCSFPSIREIICP